MLQEHLPHLGAGHVPHPRTAAERQALGRAALQRAGGADWREKCQAQAALVHLEFVRRAAGACRRLRLRAGREAVAAGKAGAVGSETEGRAAQLPAGCQGVVDCLVWQDCVSRPWPPHWEFDIFVLVSPHWTVRMKRISFWQFLLLFCALSQALHLHTHLSCLFFPSYIVTASLLCAARCLNSIASFKGCH